ncbi:MAG: hypothetical protein PHQ28_10760, partial [Mycobacterium sp.]|nr:hypothetical protein [Mycobacterium sp.]
MLVVSAQSTELFVGPPDAPLQVARIVVADVGQPTLVRVDGEGLSGEARLETGGEVVEVAVTVRRPVPGERRAARVHAGDTGTDFEFTVAEPGWTMF